MLPYTQANEIIDEKVKQTGVAFWKALADADIEAMKNFYAPEIILIAGSELLKEKWGINPTKTRNTNLKLSKESLMQGYRKMIAPERVEKWKTVFSSIDTAKIIFQSAKQYKKHFENLKDEDIAMIVPTNVGDDRLYFIFSKKQDNTWLITHEATDY